MRQLGGVLLKRSPDREVGGGGSYLSVRTDRYGPGVWEADRTLFYRIS